MERKPRAFDEKVVLLDAKNHASPHLPPTAGVTEASLPVSALAEPASASHEAPGRPINKFGCNCRKSKCIKKYCQCYAAGVKCSVYCQCVDCSNMS